LITLPPLKHFLFDALLPLTLALSPITGRGKIDFLARISGRGLG
jgi:hypothetical protein